MPTLGAGPAAGGGGWSPEDLTGLAPTVLPALSRSMGLLWQDAAKTVPATEGGDPVRVATCPFLLVDYVAPGDSSRPLLWDEGDDKWSLSFDGVDDQLEAAVTWVGSAGSSSVRFVRTSGERVPVLATVPAQDDDWYLYDGHRYACNFRASRLNDYATGVTDSDRHTYTQQSGASAYAVYIDGAQIASDGAVWESPTAIKIGAPILASERLCGRIFGAVIAMADWDDPTRELVETYLGAL